MWTRGKYATMCDGIKDGGECRQGADVCKDHPNNASADLKAWLSKNNMKFTVGVAIVDVTIVPEISQDEEFKQFKDFV